MWFAAIVVLAVVAIVIWRAVNAERRSEPQPRMRWEMTLEEAESVLETASIVGRDHAWVGRELEFDYRDKEGKSTRRRVLVTSVFQAGSRQYLRGHCQTRHDERYFRLDRASGDIVDIASGEVMRPGRKRRNAPEQAGEKKRKGAQQHKKKH